MNRLGNIDIRFLKGVGDARAKLLREELGIRTFRDLLYTFPFRYVDRSRFYKIAEFEGDNMPNVQVKGKFKRFIKEGEGVRTRLIGIFHDGERFLEVVWFHRIKSIQNIYSTDTPYIIFGKPSLFKGTYSMIHPEIEPLSSTIIEEGNRGVYSLTDKLRNKGVSNKTLQILINNLFNNTQIINDTLPKELVEKLHLMPLHEALATIHRPKDLRSLRKAQERMKFEELFYIQLHMLRYSRQRSIVSKGHIFSTIGKFFNKFYSEVLPFTLTNAQKRVIKEIRFDMRNGRQMNRLLQGDVGSGKTMVAFMSMLIAIDNGCQACLMAPTEILATQHYENIRQWADPLGVNVRLLTGSIRPKERRDILPNLENGDVNILIGTHAVIEDTVKFNNLGVVVIDEQHRFGVAQRAKLWNKNNIPPHVLVMTATPIPRTLAMTVYGDLDVSIIDELPPGRKPIRTLLRFDESRQQVNSAIKQQLKEGRQIYIVYPLIKENEKLSLKSLEIGLQNVCSTFSDYTVCCVHGQMSPAEKEHNMNLFVNGQAQIMVATTVIEVGVNVPNASVMIIENAERFGLSQLHQLRGRVGRGADQSYCILMSNHKITKETRRRLEIMTETSDGFIISEADLQMRGPGDLEGTQQSGLAFNLKISNLATDGQIIQRAREYASNLIDCNPSIMSALETNAPTSQSSNEGAIVLSPTSISLLKQELQFRFAKEHDWSKIS